MRNAIGRSRFSLGAGKIKGANCKKGMPNGHPCNIDILL